MTVYGSSWYKTFRLMNKLINIINIWLKFNKLSLNTSKTVYITYANGIVMLPANMKIYIDEVEVQRVQHTKYLGVIFDCHLRWNIHVHCRVRKTRYLLFYLLNSNNFVTEIHCTTSTLDFSIVLLLMV